MSSIQYTPIGRAGFRCHLIASDVADAVELTIELPVTGAEPMVSGDDRLRANPALVASVLAYGVSEFEARRQRSTEKREASRSAAEGFGRVARRLAEYEDLGSFKTMTGWCSCCFRLTTHRQVDDRAQFPKVFLCGDCGAATTPCAAPRCRHMAERIHGSVRLPRYCAEHRHEVRDFTRGAETYPDLDAIDDLRAFSKKNLARATRIVVVSGATAAVVAPAAFVAAPAVGAAIGASALGPGLTGAAATSWGLALLGGGSVASGGLGMAGGTVVVAAVGAGLGGGLGAVTTNAYVRDDKSFRIEKLRDGEGVPVLVATGFLTEGDDGWGPWETLITARYPNAPVYRVQWGAKELAAFGVSLGSGGGKAVAAAVLAHSARRGAKIAAKKIPFLGTALLVPDVLANPWHVAKSRAEKTAAVLADLLTRVETRPFVLVGHSLGARVMLRTAELLATKPGKPRLEALHLLGTAVGNGGDWKLLNDSVTEGVWNYYSSKDAVLKYVYRGVQLGQKAVGNTGFNSKFPKITDVDVSNTVPSHGAYFGNVGLQSPKGTP